MELSSDQIKRINKLCPNEWQTNEQGIFTEPYGIPDNIKEPIVYMRWEVGGVSGGSCWDSSNPQPYTLDVDEPEFVALDLVIKELMPDIKYTQFLEIQKIVKSRSETDYEYYGNCTDFKIKFIVLSELINKLKSF